MERSCSDKDSYFSHDLYVLRRPFSLVLRNFTLSLQVEDIVLGKGRYLWNIYINEAVHKAQLVWDDDDDDDDDDTNSIQNILSWAVIF
jgi:hypothetical protein